MTAHYQDETITLLHGDALAEAASLPDGSVDCIVTSPPYFGLRDYGSEGQYGLEETPAAYVETMRALFNECRRVLADDGTLWLNIGDSYARNPSKGTTGTMNGRNNPRMGYAGNKIGRPALPEKNLLGIPWRTAFALQDDGWILRNSIIWNKPNAMPESVTDRLSGRHENLFMFSKSQRYWFDLDPIREQLAYPDNEGKQSWERTTTKEKLLPGRTGEGSIQKRSTRGDGERDTAGHGRGKNPGDVWSINTQPFPGAHFAVFPQELARRCIVSGCKPGGTVLDPFSGSGTTGLVAQQNGRRYVGIDISAEYLELSMESRLSNGVLDFGVIA